MNAPKPKRQTATFLKNRFEEVGIHPKSRHGQNFLIDLNLIDVLVNAADLGPKDVVLEVGTGTGALTGMMAAKTAAVVSVELDPQLHQLASEELFHCKNVTLLLQDALRNKNNIADSVIEAVQQKLTEIPDARFKLAANLPYNIATPLISNLLLTPITPVQMTVTIQKELAERIVAVPRTKDYSALSIWIQSLCKAEIVRILPPRVFWPRPKVDSAIINIFPDPERRAAIPDLPQYHTFVRSLFFHRRKFLRSVLIAAFKKELEKSHIDQVMDMALMGPETRAEELPVERIQELYGYIRHVQQSINPNH